MILRNLDQTKEKRKIKYYFLPDIQRGYPCCDLTITSRRGKLHKPRPMAYAVEAPNPAGPNYLYFWKIPNANENFDFSILSEALSFVTPALGMALMSCTGMTITSQTVQI